MFGIHDLKSSSTQYVLHYHAGKIQPAGAGIAFYYFKPASTIVVVPLGSEAVPFFFNELSADFQPLSVQG